MTCFEAARLIDISAVRTHHTISDVENIVEIARRYRFINVHTLPCWVKTLSGMLTDDGDIFVGAPVGFPSGAHKTEVKILEAKELIKDGVEEMDIMMNISMLKHKDYAYIKNEIKSIVSLARDYAIVKVIIELNCLTDEEMFVAADLVIQSGADFIKTGTGWIPGDANIERIKKLKKETHGIIKMKAAGGIRTREEFDALLDLGVERFGINTKSALEIVESFSSSIDKAV